MPAEERISEIFSMLHDGAILSWEGDAKLLTITVDCIYLAELIDPGYENFFIELYDVIGLEMELLPADYVTPPYLITDYDAILKAEFEINSSDVKDGTAMIYCNADIDQKYDGGYIMLNSGAVKIYDQGYNELTVDEFYIIVKKYWDRFRL